MRVAERARAVTEGGSWVPRENLHVTIAFIGSVDEERVSDVAAAIERITRPAIPTSVTGTGAFPSTSRARVFWLGLADEAGAMASIVEACGEALSSLVPRQERRWRAHVTLARFRPPVPAPVHVAADPVEGVIDRVILYESRLGGSRPPRYIERAVVGLG